MRTLDIPKPTATRYMYYSTTTMIAAQYIDVSVKEMVHQHNLRTCTALITWRDIDKVYQHSDTMLLYFLLMEILNITGTLEHILLDMYLSLQTLKKRYVIILITHGFLHYILYLYLTLYNNIKA